MLKGRTALVSTSQTSAVSILGWFAALFILLDRIPALLGTVHRTLAFLVASAVSVLGTVAVQALFFGHPIQFAVRLLGFGPPDGRTMMVTGLVSALMLAYFPLFSVLTGARFAVPGNWPWILLGLLAIHGVAEEVLFRGFVFRNLRTGRSFERAAFLSLLAFAAAHLYLFTYMPVALALFATLVALASAFPLAYVFERGNNTIWAPAVLHTVAHSISLAVTSEQYATTAAILWMAVWTVSALLIYRFRGRLFGLIKGNTTTQTTLLQRAPSST